MAGIKCVLGERSTAYNAALAERDGPAAVHRPTAPFPKFHAFGLQPKLSTKRRKWRRLQQGAPPTSNRDGTFLTDPVNVAAAEGMRAADAEAASNATYAEMPEIVVQSGGGRKKKAKTAGGGGGAAQQKGLFRKKNDTKRQKATSAR
jgi:hypothetical protein